jgi:hypothetical protein
MLQKQFGGRGEATGPLLSLAPQIDTVVGWLDHDRPGHDCVALTIAHRNEVLLLSDGSSHQMPCKWSL